MSSNSFIKYLKSVAEKTDVIVEKNHIKWFNVEKTGRRVIGFLDMYYFDEKGDYIILNKSTAYDLKERLEFLEKSVAKYRKWLKILSLTCVFMLITIVLILVLR
ncbi:MAG: hypothetical protein DRN04_02280 [Thermoprotei archaeon]|nr:MAG: hypothetical protein DRN04_02280 [Thermoprotei archaeon]